MRGLVFIVALAAILLGGCKEKTTAGALVPAGYIVGETAVTSSLAECEGRVRHMTKGGEIDPQIAGDGITTYEFTLNSGRRIWQSCSVQSDGQYVHVQAVSEQPVQ